MNEKKQAWTMPELKLLDELADGKAHEAAQEGTVSTDSMMFMTPGGASIGSVMAGDRYGS